VFVALVIQHAMRMHRNMLSSVAYLGLPYYFTLSRKGHKLRTNIIEHKSLFWFSLQILSETFSILRRNDRKKIVNYPVEIPTRCSFVIEFIIPKLIEGSTCFERHTAHHQEL
jgi:hypothetical protein